MTSQVKIFIVALTILFSLSGVASAADYAPTPKKAPREPVSKQTLADHKAAAAIPASRVIEGTAVVIDNERLRIRNFDVRLFGIVPPQLSASYGPQARAALDKLTQNTNVRCAIRDRASDGRLLATCNNSSNTDLAMEMLRRGFAVTARGSLLQTELAAPYAAAEQAAQAQKLGIWSGAQNSPSVNITPVAPAAPAKTETAAASPPDTKAALGEAAAEVVKDKDAALKIEPLPASSLMPSIPPAVKKEAAPEAVVAPLEEPVVQEPSFVERYQLLLTGILMLLTVLSVVTAVLMQKRSDKKEELRSIAAALRGELMAAKAVCIARLQQFSSSSEEKDVSWPRVRVLVFQAHVGRIGWLGAELARQISSIYGLASDYASYYQANSADDAKAGSENKKQALEKLVSHIDTVLPRLANIENKKSLSGSVKSLLYPALSALPLNIGSSGLRSAPLSITSVAVSSGVAAAPAVEQKASAAEEITTPVREKAEDKTEVVAEEKVEETAEEKSAVVAEGANENQPEAVAEEKVEEVAAVVAEEEILPTAEVVASGAVPDSKAVATAWERLKNIKDFVQDKLILQQPLESTSEHDEYMALLNAEAEAFASYDFSEYEAPRAKSKKRRRSGG
ncbi:MAG: thermonuclease family protein [Alphaproteobacteria bacterium]|nr:thermonuclease family protein [Alphaproteobacteria bacterium]